MMDNDAMRTMRCHALPHTYHKATRIHDLYIESIVVLVLSVQPRVLVTVPHYHTRGLHVQGAIALHQGEGQLLLVYKVKVGG